MGTGERIRYRTVFADSARWNGFVLRPDDIVISTPAKCGTTWLQMICALEIFQNTRLDLPLDRISPWLDVLMRPLDEVLADLEAQTHRRFIKTHTPLDGLPFDDQVTYVCATRDPRDVAVSWDSHLSNINPAAFLALREQAVGAVDLEELLAAAPPPVGETAHERFWSWVDPPAPGKAISDLEIMLHHLDTFWQVRDQPNIMLLRFEDLLEDLEAQMRDIAGRLGIAIAETVWPDLVQAATFEDMKGRASQLVPEASHDGFYDDRGQFFRTGSTGQWRQILSDDELPRYAARVAECAPADLAAWIHRPPLPTADNNPALRQTT
jgi:aryl sulfotransferase